jgi:hypothetical protein
MSAPDRDLLRTRWTRSDRIVGRRIAGEYVLVPLMGSGAEVDSIFTLNRVGTFIWEHLDGRKSGEDVVDEMGRRFEVGPERAQTDYCDFVRKLQSIRAVKAADEVG